MGKVAAEKSAEIESKSGNEEITTISNGKEPTKSENTDKTNENESNEVESTTSEDKKEESQKDSTEIAAKIMDVFKKDIENQVWTRVLFNISITPYPLSYSIFQQQEEEIEPDNKVSQQEPDESFKWDNFAASDEGSQPQSIIQSIDEQSCLISTTTVEVR